MHTTTTWNTCPDTTYAVAAAKGGTCTALSTRACKTASGEASTLERHEKRGGSQTVSNAPQRQAIAGRTATKITGFPARSKPTAVPLLPAPTGLPTQPSKGEQTGLVAGSRISPHEGVVCDAQPPQHDATVPPQHSQTKGQARRRNSITLSEALVTTVKTGAVTATVESGAGTSGAISRHLAVQTLTS